MKKIWTDRRLFIATFGICLLFILGYAKDFDVPVFIATIVGTIAAANAAENIKSSFTKTEKKTEDGK